MPRLLFLVVAVLLAGCGQKGPLYLPAPAGPAVPAPVPTDPAATAPGATAPAAGAGNTSSSDDRERAAPAAQP